MKGTNKRNRRQSDVKKACPGTTCCDKTGKWIKRNLIHFVLVMSAVGALLGAILGSLDSCSDETRNVTTTQMLTTPLESVVLIDGSGSMCLQNGAGCTAGTCIPETTNCVSSANCTCADDRWTPAKRGIQVLNDELMTNLNSNTDGSNDKFYAGLIQWSQATENFLKIEANLTLGNATANNAAAAMNLRTGGTYWGTGLCQGYKMLETQGSAQANKLLVLLADGDLSGNGVGVGTCASPDVAGRGENGPCYCDYLWARAENVSFTSSEPDTSTQYVEAFIKSRNVSIMSILVNNDPSTTIDEIYQAASCDDIPQANASSCDYFFRLDDFVALQARATEIAEKQRSLAQSTETVSTSGSVSVCSLDFLYALIAFVPFLVYLIYRTIDIKAKSKKLRRQLVEMIKSGDIQRGDIKRFASIATNLLLPHLYSSDIDWRIAYLLFQCPCMRPASNSEMEALLAQSTIAL